MLKYTIISFDSFGDDETWYSDSWFFCKLKMLQLRLQGKTAVWIERTGD